MSPEGEEACPRISAKEQGCTKPVQARFYSFRDAWGPARSSEGRAVFSSPLAPDPGAEWSTTESAQ